MEVQTSVILRKMHVFLYKKIGKHGLGTGIFHGTSGFLKRIEVLNGHQLRYIWDGNNEINEFSRYGVIFFYSHN